MKRLALIISIACPAIACGPAGAEPRQQKNDGARTLEQLQKADVNQDGAVSRKEFKEYRASQFSRLDRNHDGSLTDSDIPAFAKKRTLEGMSFEQMIPAFDKDGDRKLSRNEFVEGPTPVFDRADANGDGVIIKAELDAARTMRANR